MNLVWHFAVHVDIVVMERSLPMSALPRTQSERLDFRISSTQKSFIERAASIQGQTLTSFASDVLLKAADEIIQKETVRTLSARDSQTFLALLSSDAEPNAALKAAAKRYKSRVGARRGR